MDILINYKNTFNENEYKELRASAGWSPLSDSQIANIINNSNFKIAAYINDQIAGMARCITDNGYLYLLCDIIISPNYQGMGIGKKMLLKFIDEIKNSIGNSYAKLYIMSLKGKEGFYKSLGFNEEIATGLAIEINKETL